MHALIIHPELAGRARFREAARSAELFSSIQMSSTLCDGMERLQQGFYPVTSIFISRQFDREIASQFMHSARERDRARGTAFLTVLPQPSVTPTEAAALAMEGADSVLLEPYSTNALRQTTKLAHAIVRQRSMAYQKAGIELLLPRLAAGIDTVAHAIKQGRRTPHMSNELLSLQQSLRRIPTELESFYFTRLIDVFNGETPPTPREESPRPPLAKNRSSRSAIIIQR